MGHAASLDTLLDQPWVAMDLLDAVCAYTAAETRLVDIDERAGQDVEQRVDRLQRLALIRECLEDEARQEETRQLLLETAARRRDFAEEMARQRVAWTGVPGLVRIR